MLTQMNNWMHQNDLPRPTTKILVSCRHIESLVTAIVGEYKVSVRLAHCLNQTRYFLLVRGLTCAKDIALLIGTFH